MSSPIKSKGKGNQNIQILTISITKNEFQIPKCLKKIKNSGKTLIEFLI